MTEKFVKRNGGKFEIKKLVKIEIFVKNFDRKFKIDELRNYSKFEMLLNSTAGRYFIGNIHGIFCFAIYLVFVNIV